MRHLRDDNSLVVGFEHTYDRASNKLSERNLHAVADSELYTYDSAQRLTSFERGELNANADAVISASPHTPLHGNWSFDGVGNWTSVDGDTGWSKRARPSAT